MYECNTTDFKKLWKILNRVMILIQGCMLQRSNDGFPPASECTHPWHTRKKLLYFQQLKNAFPREGKFNGTLLYCVLICCNPNNMQSNPINKPTSESQNPDCYDHSTLSWLRHHSFFTFDRMEHIQLRISESENGMLRLRISSILPILLFPPPEPLPLLGPPPPPPPSRAPAFLFTGDVLLPLLPPVFS